VKEAVTIEEGKNSLESTPATYVMKPKEAYNARNALVRDIRKFDEIILRQASSGVS